MLSAVLRLQLSKLTLGKQTYCLPKRKRNISHPKHDCFALPTQWQQEPSHL